MTGAAPPCPKCGKEMHLAGTGRGGKIKWICRTYNGRKAEYCYSTTLPGQAVDHADAPKFEAPRGNTVFKRKLKAGTQVYIITAAQNATPVHPEFWAILKQVKKHRNGEILAQPIRYKNPTSLWTASQANDEVWAPEITPYLWNTRLDLNQNLVFLADAKIQVTESDPLSGFDVVSAAASCIVGHSKMHLKTVATPSNKMAKICTTTGAVTVPNFTDTKRGTLGKFHHSLSALIVEIDGPLFWIRQLTYDKKTQSATDLDTRYYVDRAVKAPRPLALIQGDSHLPDSMDPKVEEATFGRRGIVKTLNPRHLIWHDAYDAYEINPHHTGDPFIAIAKVASGRASVESGVKRTCEFIRARTIGDIVSVVVPSNHDDMVRRWIVSTDWKTQPGNAEFYLSTALQMVRGTKMTPQGTEYPRPFVMLFPSMVDSMDNIKLLADDEPFTLGGWELGMHGHLGPNGSRGSIRNLRRIGLRSMFGHGHGPGIDEGATQVGTSTWLKLEYTKGPGSWLNCHAILHDDGKRQLMMIIDGRHRL